MFLKQIFAQEASFKNTKFPRGNYTKPNVKNCLRVVTFNTQESQSKSRLFHSTHRYTLVTMLLWKTLPEVIKNVLKFRLYNKIKFQRSMSIMELYTVIKVTEN